HRPRRAGAPWRQRPAVLDRRAAGRRAVRSVRDLSAGSAAARPAAQRRQKIGAADVGGRLGPRGAAAAARPDCRNVARRERPETAVGPCRGTTAIASGTRGPTNDQRPSEMLSTAIVLAQHEVTGVIKWMTSASIAGNDCVFVTVTNSPVVVTVFCRVNAAVPFA